MAASTFFADRDQVYMRDGPWEVRLSTDQCEGLLTIFEEANAIKAHTSLYDACQAAGHIPRVSPIRRGPLLVVDNASSAGPEAA